MMYLWLFYVLLGMSKILTAEPLYPLQSTFKVVYRIRTYQGVGPSREQWREMIPPDMRDTPSTETKERCGAGLVSRLLRTRPGRNSWWDSMENS
jgi:hypothetical protein